MGKSPFLYVLAATLILIGVGKDAPAAGKKKPQPPPEYVGFVNDGSANMVRSDGRGPYVDGEDCVSVLRLAGGGWFMIRTVSNTDACNSQTTHRYFEIDFGSPTTEDLDGDGELEQVESAPARIQFANAFAPQSATSTPVGLIVMHVNGDGTTTQDTGYTFTYQNEAQIIRDDSGTVDLILSGDKADADLYKVSQDVNPKNGRPRTTYELVGRYNMPFHVQAVPVQ